jgi:hypothetical protein
VIALLEESLIDAFASSAGVIHGLDGSLGSLSRKNGPTKQVIMMMTVRVRINTSRCCCDS